jgi:4-hydroxybenzoate polyprenyltransferase
VSATTPDLFETGPRPDGKVRAFLRLVMIEH